MLRILESISKEEVYNKSINLQKSPTKLAFIFVNYPCIKYLYKDTKMQTFIKSSYINCDVKSLFDFHLDTNNLTFITPPDTRVELLTKDFKPQVSQILKIKSTKYFIPMNWEVKIEKLDEPNLLVDLALKSPFAYWEHKHIFIKHGNMSELKDVITFKMPFGFLGRLLEGFVKNDLQKMFDFRHKITKEILEKGKN